MENQPVSKEPDGLITTCLLVFFISMLSVLLKGNQMETIDSLPDINPCIVSAMEFGEDSLVHKVCLVSASQLNVPREGLEPSRE